MRLAGLDVVDELVRRRQRLVPAALPVAVEGVLRALPADEAVEPETVGNPTALLVQLARAPQVAEQSGHPREVRGRRGFLVRMGRSRDRNGLLEIVKPSRITGVNSRNTKGVQVTRPRGVKPELLRQPQRLGPELDGPAEVIAHHRDAGQLLEHIGLLGRRSAVLDEAEGALQVSDGLVAIAAAQPDPAEQRLRLRRGLGVPGPEEAARRLLEHAVVEADVVNAAAGVGQ